jgi:hypothetical protein
MKQFLFAISAGCLAISSAAVADTVYTSRSAFDAAAGALTTITFDGIAAPGSFVNYGGGPLTLSGATFTTNGTLFVIDPGYYGSAYPNGGFLNADYAGVDTITATVPSTTAVGFDIGGLAGPQIFTIGTSDGGSFVLSTGDSITGTNSLDFFGVTTSAPITSLTVTYADGSYGALDNFSFGTSAVPEPTTWAMILVGFGLAGAAVRSSRKQALTA